MALYTAPLITVSGTRGPHYSLWHQQCSGVTRKALQRARLVCYSKILDGTYPVAQFNLKTQDGLNGAHSHTLVLPRPPDRGSKGGLWLMLKSERRCFR